MKKVAISLIVLLFAIVLLTTSCRQAVPCPAYASAQIGR